MQLKPITAIIVLLLVVVSLSVAGCTVSLPSNIPFVSQSHVQALVNAWHDNVNNDSDPHMTLRSWQDTSQGSDSSRVRYTEYNSSSGYTTTYDLQVKEFKQTSDATSFVDSMNTGYVTVTGSSIFTGRDMNHSIYTKAMGHNPTNVDVYVKVNSLFPPIFSMIAQLDEFVIYGSATSVSGLG
jgi:hypothetical protein